MMNDRQETFCVKVRSCLQVAQSCASAFLMSGISIVDTSETCLVLWASFPSSLVPQLDAMRALKPEHIMKVTPEGSWVPLWRDQADALLKVLWCSDTSEVAIVKVVLSSLGLGHYFLKGTLQTQD